MFNFFKKSKKYLLDDNLISSLSLEIGMFQNWYLINGPKDLNFNEISVIVRKILEHKKLNFNDNDIFLITSKVFSFDFGELNKLSKKMKFNDSIDEYCKLNGIPESYYIFENS